MTTGSMHRLLALALWAMALLLAAPLGVTPARAVTCSAVASTINFGTLAIGSLANATTSGTIIEGCTGGWTTAGNLATCNAIGQGDNSPSGSRTMIQVYNGITYSIVYQLYTNSARSTVYAYPGADKFNIPYTTANGGSATTTTYAKIISAPGALPPGTYVDTYSNANEATATFDTWNTANPPVICGVNAFYTGVPITFTVQVTLPVSCVISALPLSFGSRTVLTANIDAQTTLSATCTNLANYSVALSAGGATGATVTTRKMTGPGGATIAYGLYQDSGHSVNWGNTVGTDAEGGQGNGSAQTLTVYGRIPPQTTPTVGNYTDTVIATLWY